jgi:hypothetical protein
VSHTAASRETVLTVSAPTGFKSRLFFRDTLKPVYKIKERTDVMNEAKNKNLFIRVSEKEKNIIEQNAKKCGLSVSEYLRQRASIEMTANIYTHMEKEDAAASVIQLERYLSGGSQAGGDFSKSSQRGKLGGSRKKKNPQKPHSF